MAAVVVFTAAAVAFTAGVVTFTAAATSADSIVAAIPAISTAQVSIALTGAALAASAVTGTVDFAAIPATVTATDLISASASLPIGGMDIRHGGALIRTMLRTTPTTTTTPNILRTIPIAWRDRFSSPHDNHDRCDYRYEDTCNSNDEQRPARPSNGSRPDSPPRGNYVTTNLAD